MNRFKRGCRHPARLPYFDSLAFTLPQVCVCVWVCVCVYARVCGGVVCVSKCGCARGRGELLSELWVPASFCCLLLMCSCCTYVAGATEACALSTSLLPAHFPPFVCLLRACAQLLGEDCGRFIQEQQRYTEVGRGRPPLHSPLPHLP